jgi:hypothetical protein
VDIISTGVVMRLPAVVDCFGCVKVFPNFTIQEVTDIYKVCSRHEPEKKNSTNALYPCRSFHLGQARCLKHKQHIERGLRCTITIEVESSKHGRNCKHLANNNFVTSIWLHLAFSSIQKYQNWHAFISLEVRNTTGKKNFLHSKFRS